MNCVTHVASTLRNNSLLSATAVTDYCIMRINRYTHQILQGSHKCCSHTCLIQFFCITKIDKFVDNLKAYKSIIAKWHITWQSFFSKSKLTLNYRTKKPRIPSTKFNATMDGHHIRCQTPWDFEFFTSVIFKHLRGFETFVLNKSLSSLNIFISPFYQHG